MNNFWQIITDNLAVFLGGGGIGYLLKKVIDEKFEDYRYEKNKKREQAEMISKIEPQSSRFFETYDEIPR